jgi:hypothetical protein
MVRVVTILAHLLLTEGVDTTCNKIGRYPQAVAIKHTVTPGTEIKLRFRVTPPNTITGFNLQEVWDPQYQFP